MKRWFLPQNPDVLRTLRTQAEVTVEALDALVAWCEGDRAKGDVVRKAEHRADEVRRELQRQLRAAFSLPLDGEDLYSLSERLDDILNGAKNLVREAEVMGMEPDEPQTVMAERVAAGVHHLSGAFAALGSDADRAVEEADLAIACQRDLERRYRSAMSALLQESEVRTLMGRRELYRRMARLGDAVVQVAERVWYSVIKES